MNTELPPVTRRELWAKIERLEAENRRLRMDAPYIKTHSVKENGAPSFHCKDGLIFDRIVSAENFGGVLVHRKGQDGSVLCHIELTAEEWASVVSSMTALGESGALWRAIVALQKGSA